jgi:hypothetical protein
MKVVPDWYLYTEPPRGYRPTIRLLESKSFSQPVKLPEVGRDTLRRRR